MIVARGLGRRGAIGGPIATFGLGLLSGSVIDGVRDVIQFTVRIVRTIAHTVEG